MTEAVRSTTKAGSEAYRPTIDEQRRFWDWHWQHWQERKAVSDWALLRGERVLDIVRSLGLHTANILDLGCGIGWFSDKLTQFGRVTGIDLSADAIAKARATYPHITFIAGNALETALPQRRFDLVVSQEVLPHVENQPRYVEVAANALRPGGYFIVTMCNKFVLERLGSSMWEAWPREHIERFLPLRNLKTLLRPHFRVLRATTVLPLGDAGILRLLNSHKLNKALETVLPGRSLEALKERAGLGLFRIVLAQRIS